MRRASRLVVPLSRHFTRPFLATTATKSTSFPRAQIIGRAPVASMASQAGSASMASVGIKNDNINQAAGVSLNPQQKVAVGSVLDVNFLPNFLRSLTHSHSHESLTLIRGHTWMNEYMALTSVVNSPHSSSRAARPSSTSPSGSPTAHSRTPSPSPRATTASPPSGTASPPSLTPSPSCPTRSSTAATPSSLSSATSTSSRASTRSRS